RPGEVIEIEQRADHLRGRVVSASRWNLRANRIAQGTLDAIEDGEGSADCAQDLEALAVFVLQHEGAFANDQTFDAKASAKECGDVAKELREALSGPRADLTRQQAKDLRDRAYTY